MKIVKDAVIAIGVIALVATGVGAIAGAGITAGITVAAAAASSIGISAGLATTILIASAGFAALSLLQDILPKPSQGGSQTKWKADPYAGLPYVMGRTLVSGNIIYKRGHGPSNKYETFVTILSTGPIKSIDTTFANKTTVNFDSAGNAIGTYANRIYKDDQLGACPETSALAFAADTPTGWSSAHKLSGLAAAMDSFVYDSKGKTTFTTEVQMSAIVEGNFVYDPRLDSTYPGGSGACRALDETTYVYSEDPHLHGLTWTLGRYQNGKRLIGIGAPIALIDVAAFVEGANLNQARNWKIGGQVVSRPDTPWNNLKTILQAGGAKPVLIGGRISCMNRAPRVSLATIRPADIVGDSTFSGTQPRRSRLNGIIPQYRSEAHDWELVSADGVIIGDFVTIDGDERTEERSYPLVQDVTQAAQLAAYDIYDSREAGPGNIPLGPWWLNYRIGDCVTLEPEDDLSIKTIIQGRSIDAQTASVTYTLLGETDGKDAFALGQTGVAPPVAAFSYSTVPDAPASGSWTITGATLSASGASIPAIEVDGAVDDPSASQLIFELRPYVSGTGIDDSWESVSIDAPTVTRKVFSAVTPGTQYQVSIRNFVRGVASDRLILGPATAGQLSTASGAHQLNSQSVAYPITSNDTSITIAAFTGVVDDGRSISFPSGSLTGLTSGDVYYVFWDASSSSYSAAVSPALTQTADSSLIFVGAQATSTSGTYPTPSTPPAGHVDGCPVPEAMILLANEAGDGPGATIAAGDIEPGRDWVWSPHEQDLGGEWAAWPVVGKRLLDSEIWTANGRPHTSPSHLWATDAGWTRMDTIGRFDRFGTVVSITIGEAHTYALVADDGSLLVSHNKLAKPI